MKKQYDIFISYRRSSYDTANLIATRLKAAGYSVFFDMETLRSGKFNEQLFEVIDHCKDFVLVLPPEALDRCVHEDDWVRLEACRAMSAKKNIIPVMLNGFSWPNPMPVGMEELCNYQALTASSVEYFDLAMEKLQRRYLLSKKHLPVRKLLNISGIIIGSLLALLTILSVVFIALSKPVCLKYATSIAMDASAVHMIASENESLRKNWDDFSNNIVREYRPERVKSLQEDMLARIDLVEQNLTQLWTVDSLPLPISSYEAFLLSFHAINAEEIMLSPVFSHLYYVDYLGQLDVIRNAVMNPTSIHCRYADALFEVFNHSVNMYYATILSELTNFPEKSLDAYEEMYEHWIYFPIQQYKLGEDTEYYENIINTESKLSDEVLSRYESVLEQHDAALEDVILQSDKLEQQVYDGLESISATKAEIEELDQEYVQAYDALKKKCTLEEDDDQWYQWGKIRRWGAYLVSMVESRNEIISLGIYPKMSITPEVVYADMNSFLSVYQIYHPESEDYVASAKRFFCEISKGERTYAGVTIFAIKEGTSHPHFRVGDIIVGYAGRTIKNLDDLKKAYRQDTSAMASVLRLSDNSLVPLQFPFGEISNVGFLDLTE